MSAFVGHSWAKRFFFLREFFPWFWYWMVEYFSLAQNWWFILQTFISTFIYSFIVSPSVFKNKTLKQKAKKQIKYIVLYISGSSETLCVFLHIHYIYLFRIDGILYWSLFTYIYFNDLFFYIFFFVRSSKTNKKLSIVKAANKINEYFSSSRWE